jgi:bis(5'-nucleosyl)-tetraphosphatase (symmetrical)
VATYAIGDVQGCWRSLELLLGQLPWDPARDRLWLAGDLVNRGPRSLEVLRWAASLGERVVAVLGNHDLHLLAAAEGLREPRRSDTLAPVLEAPDRDDLLAWLWRRPLVHREGEHLLVHAGLRPEWSADEAEAIADATESVLRGPGGLGALLGLMGDERARSWPAGASSELRAAAALAAFTRMRCLDELGMLDESFAGPPREAPAGLHAWHEHPGRRSVDVTVVCGHWAAQGLVVRERLIALDSGCVWGGALSAVRLEDRAVWSVPSAEAPPRR